MDAARRTYTVTSLLGVGGFGKVYRARLDAGEGFSKEVALKILTEESPSAEVLDRFRDESRILGLVRDRAVVKVDPPIRLGGKWAVVMEYVDGVTTNRLMKRYGGLPPRVCLEIVQEVARALDRIYRQPGPAGPLHLLHRDLKPANIQVTPAGEVKVLDFGIARADFDEREARTSTNIAGTHGFIAPERMYRVEGPEGDVFSLGVVLRCLVTGKKPEADLLTDEVVKHEDPDVRAVLELAASMHRVDPKSRPTAREVEDRCAELAAKMPPPSLRQWAEQHVPDAVGRDSDPVVGEVLTETMMVPTSERTGSTRSRAGAVLLLGALTVPIAAGVAATVLAVLAAWWFMTTRPPELAEAHPPEPPAPTAPASPAPEPEAPAAPTPAPVEAGGPEPAPATPAEAKPKPAPAEPAPAAAPTRPIGFSSVPLGAEVWVDGKKLGVTPLFDQPVADGRHQVEMVSPDGVRVKRTIEVGKRGSSKFIWTGGDQWQDKF